MESFDDEENIRKDMFGDFVKYCDFGKKTKFGWTIVVNKNILTKSRTELIRHPRTMPINIL